MLTALFFTIVFAGCQGSTSEKPPIHLNPNMDSQKKYKAQSYSNFFVNGSTMRMPVEGTVARGDLREDSGFYLGIDRNGRELTSNALEITNELLVRGKERYEIYCQPCHNANGDGQGLVVQKGLLPPPSFLDDKVKNFTDGYIYGVITNGVRTMPSYRHQIMVKDRWAIVAHLRKMQGK
ncbi:MAG: cytochrome c [Calditrichaeota bacterium]|nr:MAG: cytochrome c [Calditrichota bacterium]